MPDFCVAIRTHNGEKYLPEIFDALLLQDSVDSIDWEVLVVDNCSHDQTAEIVLSYQRRWSLPCQLRYYFEPVLGASIARRRAIELTDAPLVGFLDDDNVPDTGWVRAAVDFAQKHPCAAAFGGQIRGKFESPPPRSLHHIAGFLPIVERPNNICFTKGSYNRINLLPPGAGLVIRRQPWLESVPKEQTLCGPVGTSLAMKGEDIEALMHLKRAGWQIWYNADMTIFHHIPKSRLEREYLLRFFKGIGLSRYYTRTINSPAWSKPFLTAAHATKDLCRLALYWLRYHRQFSSDPILFSKLELYRSSLFGPLHILKEKFNTITSS